MDCPGDANRGLGRTRRTLASLNNGWLARGGLLRLHDDHLSFATTPIERLLFARGVRIDFAAITEVQRHPPREGDILPGGMAPRMRLLTEAKSYDFLFPSGLDDWINSLRERRRVWENRQRFE